MSWFYFGKIVTARIRPSHTAARQQADDSPVLRDAFNQSPSRTKSSVCKLNDEKVVYPPHTPIMKNWRNRGDTRITPSGSVNAARNPITNEPVIFTTRVPTGKDSPARSATNPDIQNRAPVPSAPPNI